MNLQIKIEKPQNGYATELDTITDPRKVRLVMQLLLALDEADERRREGERALDNAERLANLLDRVKGTDKSPDIDPVP